MEWLLTFIFGTAVVGIVYCIFQIPEEEHRRLWNIYGGEIDID